MEEGDSKEGGTKERTQNILIFVDNLSIYDNAHSPCHPSLTPSFCLSLTIHLSMYFLFIYATYVYLLSLYPLLPLVRKLWEADFCHVQDCHLVLIIVPCTCWIISIHQVLNECDTYIVSFYLTFRKRNSLFLIYTWLHWGSEGLNYLLKISKLRGHFLSPSAKAWVLCSVKHYLLRC